MIVQAPDNKTIDFGDLPPDQIQSAMQKLYPIKEQADVIPDVAKSVATGAGRGFLFPLDVGSKVIPAMHNAAEYLGTKAANAITGKDTQPNYVDMPPSISESILPYEPKTVPGQFGKTISEFASGSSPFLKGANKLAQVIKYGLLSGGGSEAAGQATEGTAAEPYARLAGAVLSPVSAEYVAGGLGNIGKGIMSRSSKAIKSEGIEKIGEAGLGYQKMREIGAVYHPEPVASLINKIDKTISDSGIIPENMPETQDVINGLKKYVSEKPLDLDALDQYRSLLWGPTGRDGHIASKIRDVISDFQTNTKSSDLQNGSREAILLLNKSRPEFARASRFRDIGNLVAKSGGDPAKLKANLTRYMEKTDLKKAGYSDNEISIFEDAAKTGFGEGVVNLLGKFGIDLSNPAKNWFAPLAGGGLATAGAGTLAGPGVVAAGTLAKQAGKYIARGKAERLLQEIEKRKISNTPDIVDDAPTIISGLLERPQINVPGSGFSQPIDTTMKKISGGEFGEPASRLLEYTPTPDFIGTPRGNIADPQNEIFLETLLRKLK